MTYALFLDSLALRYIEKKKQQSAKIGEHAMGPYLRKFRTWHLSTGLASWEAPLLAAHNSASH